MPRIVSPDRVVYDVADRRELKELCDRLKLGWKLGDNLRQLLGWDSTPGGGDADQRDNWELLSTVRWLSRDGSDEIVPVVGKTSHIYKTVVVPHPHMEFSQKELGRLLPSRKTGQQERKSLGPWRVVPRPAAADSAASGTSLVGLGQV